MAKRKRYPLGAFLKQFSTEAQCREYLVSLRWKEGYVCPKCGCRHACRLSNGRYQCAQCRHQASVTAGTVLHKPHMSLRRWFLAFYLVCQDKRRHPAPLETGEDALINSFTPETCPHCQSNHIKKFGQTSNHIQRYRCIDCQKTFTLVTGTIFEGPKISIREWIDYTLNIFRYVSINADSWNNRNAFTTSRYWLEKIFLVLPRFTPSVGRFVGSASLAPTGSKTIKPSVGVFHAYAHDTLTASSLFQFASSQLQRQFAQSANSASTSIGSSPIKQHLQQVYLW